MKGQQGTVAVSLVGQELWVTNPVAPEGLRCPAGDGVDFQRRGRHCLPRGSLRVTHKPSPQGHHGLLCGLRSLWVPALCCSGIQSRALLWLQGTGTAGWEPRCLLWGLRDAGEEHLRPEKDVPRFSWSPAASGVPAPWCLWARASGGAAALSPLQGAWAPWPRDALP